MLKQNRQTTYTHSLTITEKLVQHYANISGDHNPIHLDKETAQQAGFECPINHGVLNMALCLKAINPLLDTNEIIQSTHFRFLKPVYTNTTLQLHIQFNHSSNESSKIHISGQNMQQDTVLKGKAQISVIN